VFENIRYSAPEAGLQNVIHAAKQAHLHEFIEGLPDVTIRCSVSAVCACPAGRGNVWAIARAILRNAGILIFDEATNALDTLSERLIQQSIEELRQNHTLIVIAHRLSTIEHADNIVVLDKGRLVEQGALHELLALRGFFSALYYVQQHRELAEK